MNQDLANWSQRAAEIIATSRKDGTPTNSVGVSEPSVWMPLEGWGTVRDYVRVRNDSGGMDVGFYFVPDNGSSPVSFVFKAVGDDSIHVKDVGEYTRGFLVESGTRRNLTIKMALKEVARAEKMIAEINEMDTIKSAILQRGDRDFFRMCGYGSDSSWRLAKAAPGLLRD